MSDAITTVCVSLEDREDGGLRVFSDELPGLILSGQDKMALMKKIAPAITALFKAAKGWDVRVRPAKPLSEILDGKNPQTLDMHVHKSESGMYIHTKVFVVEFQQAA
jgi:hypothetical protein